MVGYEDRTARARRPEHVSLDEVQRPERAAQDLGRFHAEPTLENSRVHGPEIRMPLQVADVQIAQARVIAVDPAFHTTADEEHRSSGAVVRPPVGVLSHSAAELGERHRQDAVVDAMGSQVGVKRLHTVAELLEQSILTRALSGVRVERSQADVDDLRAHVGCEHRGSQIEALREGRLRIVNSRLVAGHEMGQPQGAGVRVALDFLHQLQVRLRNG